MKIRKAEERDLEAMALLADQKRKQYEKYQPVFHKPATDALDKHRPFLKSLLDSPGVILLVGGAEDGVEGFIFARIVDAPSVYNPGGKICFVDDFMVASPDHWETLGKVLLEESAAISKKQGAILANVVCGPKDEPKRRMLANAGYGVASEWHVKSI